ncbi:MAG: DUF819 family protein [Planctomycetes bacterium]|nr:DUF819 family protein [Planctomycetota bacterium]
MALVLLLALGASADARAQGGTSREPSPLELAASFARTASSATRGGDTAAARGALAELAAELVRAADALELPAGARRSPVIFTPVSTAPAAALASAAEELERASAAAARGERARAPAALDKACDHLESAQAHDAWITEPGALLAVLAAALALLHWLGRRASWQRVFAVLPVIAWAYFVPTILSNTGIVPREAGLYQAIKDFVLPSCLVLLIVGADLRAIARLGKPALLLFFGGTFGIVLGAVLSFLALRWMLPTDLGDELPKGLAALAGSWVGGAANFLAVGAALDAAPSTLSRLVVVDVVVSYLWMAFLLTLPAREKQLDAHLGADRTALDDVRRRVENAPEARPRPAETRDLLALAAVALVITALARAIAPALPTFDGALGRSTWVVALVTTAAIAISFTPLRRLESAGASRLGTALLYLLVACIGVGASFASFLEAPALLALGFVWMGVHATVLWLLRRWLRAPIFFAAVGSMANVGGPASAPVVAAGFHPALAPVGALLAVLGMILGTYAGLLVGYLLAALS